MYGWIWRHLPGPVWVRLIVSLLLVAAVLAVLGFWVFPWVNTVLQQPNVTVGGS